MSYDLIEIQPLQSDFTQVPNKLLRNQSVSNDLFRVCCWLLSFHNGGSVSSRQIAQAAGLGYDGRPHRAVMRALRRVKVLSSQSAMVGDQWGEWITIDLRRIIEASADDWNEDAKSPVRAKRPNGRAKRPNGRAKRPNVSCVSSEPLKTNAPERVAPQGQARSGAETRVTETLEQMPELSVDQLWRRAKVAADCGQLWKHPETGLWFEAWEFAENGAKSQNAGTKSQDGAFGGQGSA